MLLAAEDHPLARASELHVRDLEGVELALPAPHTAFREELDLAARNAGASLSSKAEIDGLRLLLSIALRGYGPALLPATTLSDPPPGFKTLRVSGPAPAPRGPGPAQAGPAQRTDDRPH